ncbi:MAG: hypothetical protein UMU75_02495 [Halomonas sp.]|nr:hypothetical protein [Halomonas sp.]
MLTHRQRSLIIASAWLVTLAVAPFSTLIVHHYFTAPATHEDTLGGPAFLTSGIFLFTASFGLLSLAMTKLSSDLDELEGSKRGNALAAGPLSEQTEGLLPEEYTHGLRLLRMAGDSPLRGLVMERAIILTINGKHPSTAAEANEALLKGGNRVEWSDARGQVHSVTFYCRRNDLKAQFEQINRKAIPDPMTQ